VNREARSAVEGAHCGDGDRGGGGAALAAPGAGTGPVVPPPGRYRRVKDGREAFVVAHDVDGGRVQIRDYTATSRSRRYWVKIAMFWQYYERFADDE
jgi:hypothetical protein